MRSADLVTVAQAFHWFEVGAALAEIRRILRPGGACAAFWNLRDDGASPFLAAYQALLLRHSTEYEALEKAEPTSARILAAAAVRDAREAEFPHVQQSTARLSAASTRAPTWCMGCLRRRGPPSTPSSARSSTATSGAARSSSSTGRESCRSGSPGTMMRREVLVAVALAALAPAPVAATAAEWRLLEPGLELAELPLPALSDLGDSRLCVLRIDPARFDLVLLNASAPGRGEPLTARAWCEQAGLVAAINASMYQTDFKTSVGLMRTAEHVNNAHVGKDRAVLAFDRADAGVPPADIIDLTCQDFAALRPRYRTLVQSIRMVSCTGENRWQQQPRKWSTAAIGIDKRGRVLFMHCRSPYTTHDLIDGMLALPLDLAKAMYVEGGPEAQLYLHSGDFALERVGSFETGFTETNANTAAWPVPNVVGIVRRAVPR
jgi:hypothetical protein